MRAWVGLLAAAVVMSLALAGCSSEDPPRAKSSGPSTTTSRTASTSSATGSSTHASSSSSASGTTTGSPASNHAPTGTMAVAVNGTSATFNLTGLDQDGDALAWNLTFGDGASKSGASLPASEAHTYATAGNYTAVFTVSDGKETKAYNATVAVVAAGAGGAGQAVTFTGTILAPDPFAVASGVCLLPVISSEAPQETFGASFDITGHDGWAYAFDVDGVITAFADAAGNAAAGANSGTVPAGATVAYTCGNSPDAAMLDYTLTLTPAA